MSQPYMVGPVLLGADELVAAFVRSRIVQPDGRHFQGATALGVVRDKKLLGGVVYYNHREGIDTEVSFAFDSPAWASKVALRILFGYPFNQLGCVRLTAICARKNKHSRRIVERLGFKLEGTLRKALDGRQDLMVYGMLKTECKWIMPAETRASVGKDNGILEAGHSEAAARS